MRHVSGVVLSLALAMPAAVLASDKGLDELRGDISQLQHQIDDLRQVLERDTASLDTLARQSLMGLTALNSKIAALQATLASAIEDSHKDAIVGNESLNTKADQMGSEVRSVSESVSDLADRVGTLEQRIIDLQTGLNALGAKPASGGDSGVSQTVSKTDGLAVNNAGAGPARVPAFFHRCLYHSVDPTIFSFAPTSTYRRHSTP